MCVDEWPTTTRGLEHRVCTEIDEFIIFFAFSPKFLHHSGNEDFTFLDTSRVWVLEDFLYFWIAKTLKP